MSHYEKYDLFKKLENELIHLKNRYAIQYLEKLYIYDLDGNKIKAVNCNSMTVNAINKLIEYTKEQGDNQVYTVEYFNTYKRSVSVLARSDENAKLEFERLFNCKILSINKK